MRRNDDLLRENEALRRRVSALSAAYLRINASLDLDTVLREVVESARVLTGARYGAVNTLDDYGQPRDFVTSGLTDEEQRRLMQWPDATRLFVHILPGVLGGQEDEPERLRPDGFSAGPLTFRETPMHHQGRHLGNCYLAGKERGGEFTSADDETMALFARQAAGAIANARTYRTEHLARAGLEALADNSPVGVAVFAAGTGSQVSLNREAKRLVESLLLPGNSPEQSLKLITCRRNDGRYIALDRFPLSDEIVKGERVLTEEITLSGPGGPGIRTLVNATPVHAGDGAAASVIVTLQDLSPIRGMERIQVESLEMVRHELRAPLTSIKGSAATALGASPVPSPAEMLQFFRIINEQADHMSSFITDLLDAGRIDSGMLAVTPEPTEVSALLDQARNTFLAGGARHTVLTDPAPDLPQVAADRKRIVQVLGALLSNAARHSPESSPIRISALCDGVHVAISVSAERRAGMPGQPARLFGRDSAARGPGQDRSGLGLVICKGLVEAHGGRIRAETDGPGTRYTFTVPLAAEAGGTTATARRRPGSHAQEDDPVRILVVDDDPHTASHVCNILTDAGYAVLVTGKNTDLEHIISTEKPALALLDLDLPGSGGIELTEHNPAFADLPVIFISGECRDETSAGALENGAADYIVKPFSPTELVARIRTALRIRAKSGHFTLGELTINYDRRRAALSGRPLNLTATEYELLRVLSLNAGRVSTHDTLQRRVWGRRHHGASKLVPAYINKLRRKLGDDTAQPRYIFTEAGAGYRMPNPSDL